MLDRLSQRNKRALRLGVIGVAAIVVFSLGLSWLQRWADVRKSVARSREQLKAIGVSDAERDKLMTIVPVFEMPKKEEEQKFSFRAEFNKQLKESGVKAKPLRFLPVSKAIEPGYRLLSLQCSGQADMEQILNLFANLKKNPYLVAVEEFMMKKSDPKNERSRRFDIELKVSTFVRE